MTHLETLRRSPLVRGLIVAAIAGILSGCMTTNAYTGEKQVSKTTKGAGIGALAGAAVGALTGDNSKERRKRALIGAGVGALAGGAVGNYMDRQEAKLREQLRGTGVSVTRQGDDIVLNMPGNITFATGSADLNSSFFGVLDSVALVLKEYDKTIIDVAGHTDSVGSDQTNQALSERRANTVGQYLQSKGIQQNRIATIGYGKARPIASNDTPDGRQQNRRVELTLTPLTSS
ncbi:MAG TPA: OmpA family protein [Steroidobacteraceae bacterium]|jgi:outer membrane protein OmpA-like peptidoglycan-associated protein|nr:OmpA family protein [Steroidobacteraceae bacterium]